MNPHARILRVLVPASFLLGVGFELFMSYVSVGRAGTFYDVARCARRLADFRGGLTRNPRIYTHRRKEVGVPARRFYIRLHGPFLHTKKELTRRARCRRSAECSSNWTKSSGNRVPTTDMNISFFYKKAHA